MPLAVSPSGDAFADDGGKLAMHDRNRTTAWNSQRDRALAGLLLFAMVVGCTPVRGPTGPPVLRIDSQVKELGEVRAATDEKPVAVFHVENCGIDDLKLIESVASCRCVNVSFSKTTLRAGERSLIRVCVRPDDKDASEGSARVALTTNDPARPRVSLQVTWHVVREIDLSPAQIDFGEQAPGAVVQRSSHIRTSRALVGKTIRVSSSAPANGELTCMLKGPHVLEAGTPCIVGENAGLELSIQLKVGATPGLRMERVSLAIADEPVERFSLPVYWECVPRIRALPGSIHFGTLKVGQVANRMILLNCERASTTPICRGEGLSIRQDMTRGSSTGSARYNISFQPVQNRHGPYGGHVVFDLGFDHEAVVVPVSAFVTPPAVVEGE